MKLDNLQRINCGNSYPLFVTSTENTSAETQQFLLELDKKFGANITAKYDLPIQALQQNIQEEQKRLMNEFKIDNSISDDRTNNNNSEEQDFTFAGFNG